MKQLQTSYARVHKKTMSTWLIFMCSDTGTVRSPYVQNKKFPKRATCVLCCSVSLVWYFSFFCFYYTSWTLGVFSFLVEKAKRASPTEKPKYTVYLLFGLAFGSFALLEFWPSTELFQKLWSNAFTLDKIASMTTNDKISSSILL